MRNMQNMLSYIKYSCPEICKLFLHSLCPTSCSTNRPTLQWCFGHVRSANCIQVGPVCVWQSPAHSATQLNPASVLVILEQGGKTLLHPLHSMPAHRFSTRLGTEPLIPKFNINCKCPTRSAMLRNLRTAWAPTCYKIWQCICKICKIIKYAEYA
jgi:hypothetical protein